jgi:hypothetical protein
MGRNFDHIRFGIDRAPAITKDFERLRAFYLNPDVPENVERCHVDLLKIILAEYIQPEAARLEQIRNLIIDGHGFTF